MRKTLTLALLMPLAALAQTTWNVQVGGATGSPNPPFYNPQNLVIQEGDQVTWTNTSGTHNVNGSTALFPGNPQGFTSGNPQFGAWTFSFTFTIAGTYNYHCTQSGHSATQFGQIIVEANTTNVAENDASGDVLLYPVPTADLLVVELGALRVRTAEVFSVDGQRVAYLSVGGSDRVEIDLRGLGAGAYFLRLFDMEGRAITRPFRKV